MIRTMTMEDLPQIIDIYGYYVLNTTVTFDLKIPSQTDMKKRFQRIIKNYPAWVCEKDGLIIGYCCAHEWKEKKAYSSTAETSIYIRPSYCNKGYGKILLKQLIQDSRNYRLHCLIACITLQNEASLVLHNKFGFKQAGVYREVGLKNGTWMDIVDYQLILR